MNRTQRDELAVNAARVFAQLFREYRSAGPEIRGVIEEMSEVAASAADVDEREMALATLADALGLLRAPGPPKRARPAGFGQTGDGAPPPWQDDGP